MLLIHSSGKGCLGRSHILVFVIMLLWKWMATYLSKFLVSVILFIPRRGNVDSYGNSGITRENRFLIFFQEWPYCFFRGCHYFTFSEAMPTFSTSLQGLAIFYVLDIGYLKWFEVELHCGETGTIIIRIFFLRWENESLVTCLWSSSQYMAHAEF